MTTNVYDRGKILTIAADLGPANSGAGNGITAKLPRGAVLLRLTLLTVTAFNSTTNTATVSDGTTTFANAVDIASTGAETVAGVPKFYPDGGTLQATLASTGAAPTAGRVVLVAEYTQLGLGSEIQG